MIASVFSLSFSDDIGYMSAKLMRAITIKTNEMMAVVIIRTTKAIINGTAAIRKNVLSTTVNRFLNMITPR